MPLRRLDQRSLLAVQPVKKKNSASILTITFFRSTNYIYISKILPMDMTQAPDSWEHVRVKAPKLPKNFSNRDTGFNRLRFSAVHTMKKNYELEYKSILFAGKQPLSRGQKQLELRDTRKLRILKFNKARVELSQIERNHGHDTDLSGFQNSNFSSFINSIEPAETFLFQSLIPHSFSANYLFVNFSG